MVKLPTTKPGPGPGHGSDQLHANTDKLLHQRAPDGNKAPGVPAAPRKLAAQLKGRHADPIPVTA